MLYCCLTLQCHTSRGSGFSFDFCIEHCCVKRFSDNFCAVLLSSPNAMMETTRYTGSVCGPMSSGFWSWILGGYGHLCLVWLWQEHHIVLPSTFICVFHDVMSLWCRGSIPGAGHLFRYVTNQPPKANSAFHPSCIGKWVPAVAGKAKAGMAHSISG